ncbi:global cell cycle regulator GcrA-like protein [Kordiimonas sediminis]|uniref:Global cell cycle regulator GcrA-like protein n=1 Tax=Kordiimonas sediminis TaxID=1735581 RepID=A0A919ALU4_9PROT|nr:GcrA family cell cycle regulator [Kordiimonas sediminis]GHF12921.1 global cell cycle regulator GcrA-like protein [Kordiimonas sediminis]
MAWTDERIEKLKELWDSGLSASQIAKELAEGVTRNAVIGKAHRLGLKSRPSPVKSDKTKPKAAPKKVVKKETSKFVTLLDLTDRMCKWPHGHPGDDDFHFCGKSSEPGMPYCAAHCAEAYQAQPPRRDRRQQQRAPIR